MHPHAVLVVPVQSSAPKAPLAEWPGFLSAAGEAVMADGVWRTSSASTYAMEKQL